MANEPDSIRRDQLSAFASQYLPDFFQLNGDQGPQPLPGDAGFRRYFRWNGCPGVLGVDAPPDSEDSLAFVRVADLLRNLGVHSPMVYAASLHQGLLLVEYLGDQSYQDCLSAANAGQLYDDALDSLLKMQCCTDRPPWLPLYDDAQLRQEMSLFVTWFVHQLLNYELNREEDELVSALFDTLVDSALAQPQVLVHRDYHCRNLILTADNNPGVIDFQDALWGPVTYDPVSLMRDCYLRWEPAQIEHQRDRYFARLVEQGVLPGGALEGLDVAFDFMGLQRHIKVLGVFSRLWLRDGKPGYLADLPLVMRYVLEVASAHDETRAFGDWMHSRLIPLAESTDWYQHWATAGDNNTLW